MKPRAPTPKRRGKRKTRRTKRKTKRKNPLQRPRLSLRRRRPLPRRENSLESVGAETHHRFVPLLEYKQWHENCTLHLRSDATRLSMPFQRFFHILRLAIKSIAVHRLRSTLTILGIVLGVAAVMITVGLGEAKR